MELHKIVTIHDLVVADGSRVTVRYDDGPLGSFSHMPYTVSIAHRVCRMSGDQLIALAANLVTYLNRGE